MDDYALTELDRTVDAILAATPSAEPSSVSRQQNTSSAHKIGRMQDSPHNAPSGGFFSNAASLVSAVRRQAQRRLSSGGTPPPPHASRRDDNDEYYMTPEQQRQQHQDTLSPSYARQQHQQDADPKEEEMFEDDIENDGAMMVGDGGGRVSGYGGGGYLDETDIVLRRMAMWQARKNHTLELKRREQIEKELGPCTFQPSLRQTANAPPSVYEPSPLYKDNKAWGYDEFLQRYASARQQKEDKERYVEEVFRPRGANWANQLTIPKPFALGRGVHGHKVTSLDTKRAHERMAEKVREHHYAKPSRIEPPSMPPGLFSSPNPTTILEHSPNKWRHI